MDKDTKKMLFSIGIAIVVLFITILLSVNACAKIEASNNPVSMEESETKTSVIASQEEKDKLKQLIDSAHAAVGDGEKYTETSRKAFFSKLKNAENVYASETARPADITIAEADLLEAYENLKKVFSAENYTTLAYKEIFRNPDTYRNSSLTFNGKVLQIVYDGGVPTGMRVATDGKYDDVILVYYDSEATDGNNILEDDYITIYGTYQGVSTYTTVMNAEVALPVLKADKIIIN